MDRQQIFQRLKPACIELLQVTASISQKPEGRKLLVNSLSKLLDALQSVTSKPKALDARLTEYVFVPISQVLRISRTVPVRALEFCLECISILLQEGWGGALTPELSGQLLILFTFMAKPTSAENGIAGSSEELQTIALKCIGELFTEATRTVQGRQQLTATANIPALGEAVLVVLDDLTDSNSNSVKLGAVVALSSMVSAIDDKEALASFLPKIVSSLTKVLTPSSSNRTGFRVLESSLESTSALVHSILSDQQTKDLPEMSQEGPQSSDKVVRSSSWLQATAAQIKIALSNILKLRKHDKIEVRKALLHLCLTVIQECRTSLSECISMVTETMISLAGRGGSQDTVESDLKMLLSTDQILSNLLRESLYGWVISLPRLMQSKDDTGRRHIIHQISVTLRLLDQDHVMINNILADNLRDGISVVFHDSKGMEAIVEATPTSTLDDELVLSKATSNSFKPLQLRLKGQQDTIAEFGHLLGELAKSEAAIAVIQDLVATIDNGIQENRLASFWISVNLLRNMMVFNPTLDDFIDFGTSNPQEEVLDNLYSHSLTTLSERDLETTQDWHYHALALEVIALQAGRYKSEFRPELSETLYPVLHHLGSQNPNLRNHAIICLNVIAASCGYTNASDMVISNVDYIVNAVGLKLSYGDVSPQAPQVLLMMMRLCGPPLLPYLDDLVGSIFGALERYHGYPKLVELLFAVLKGMAEEGVKTPQLAITSAAEQDSREGKDEMVRLGEILDAVREMEAEARKRKEGNEELPKDSFPHKPWKGIEELDSNEDTPIEKQEEEPSNALSQPEDPPPPAPRTFDTLLKISELTQHYLTSSSPSLRTSLLSLLQTTLPALAKHENSFLPLINTLWPVLLPRLEDPEAYIVANALDIVALMCEHAGNFMRSRIDGAWELIKSIHRRTIKQPASRKATTGKMKSTRLVDLSNITKKITGLESRATTEITHFRPEVYVDAPTRMIWDALVRLLCAISRHVTIREEHFDDVLDMLDPVLTNEQVKKALDVRNADAVWLRLYKKSKKEAERNGVDFELPVELGGPVKEVAGAKPECGFVKL